eukprot:SAG31_NODE_9231_length_1312_cov_3.657873_1_plen_206_part_10
MMASDFVCAGPAVPSQPPNISESTDFSSVLFDDIEHGIQTWLTIYLNTVVGMYYSVFGPIGFRNSAGHSDVSDASANGLSDLVPFYTIGYIIILALLLTRDIHKWIPCISSCMGLDSGCLPGSARALQNHQRSRSVRHQLSILSQLLIMTLCALVFQSASFVRAGETQTEPIACESPHQVATVAQAVTDSCEEGGEDSGAVSGGFQ